CMRLRRKDGALIVHPQQYYQRVQPMIAEADTLRLVLTHQPLGKAIEGHGLPFIGAPGLWRGSEQSKDHRRPFVFDLVEAEVAKNLLDNLAIRAGAGGGFNRER